MSLPMRIVEKISLVGDCWECSGAPSTKGYARVSWNGKARFAHRVIYEILVGPIPEGMEIDHLCRNRKCVNPDHLEPVMHGDNVRRDVERAPDEWGKAQGSKTHCPRGHEYDIISTQNGGRWAHRRCRVCARETDRRRRLRRKE